MNLFRGQKVKVTRLINAVKDNAPYTDRGHYNYNFLKISLSYQFTGRMYKMT